MNALDFKKMKQAQQKISLLTCYDYWTAQLIAQTAIDCLLVGDSLAMVMHGHATTLPATLEMMVLHLAAVVRGAPNKFIIADMPFLSYRQGLRKSMQAVEKLMQAGAQAIKLEGVGGHERIIAHIVNSGVPVIGHIGLTPQTIHHLGGFKVQGKGATAGESLLEQAQSLAQLGCTAVVLECIPSPLAQRITQSIDIPTIGIGAGVHVDGQILVLQDMLGMNLKFKPKFLKTYLDGQALFKSALLAFDQEVKQGLFPSVEHSYAGGPA